jgi:hypothetical protein
MPAKVEDGHRGYGFGPLAIADASLDSSKGPHNRGLGKYSAALARLGLPAPLLYLPRPHSSIPFYTLGYFSCGPHHR